MPQVQSQAPSGEGEIPALEKIFEVEREKDRLEYRIYAKFENDIAERVDIAVVWYPMKKYGNNVTLSMTLYLEDGLNLEVRKVRNSWGGSGLDFKNRVTIYTTQELEDEHIFSRERYEKISSVKDVKTLISDILELFEDFVKYYVKNVVEEFIEEEEQ
jgi:hypothetical protein